MTNDQAKKIFDHYKTTTGYFIGRKSLFVGYHLFSKADVLGVEYISRVSYWDKAKDRYMCRAKYNTTEFSRVEFKKILEAKEEPKELTLF